MATKIQNILKIRTMVITLCVVIFTYTWQSHAENLEMNSKTESNSSQNTKGNVSVRNSATGEEISIELFKSDRSVTVVDIKELTRRSTDIIVGRPLVNKSSFRKGNVLEDVHTMHLILVQTVLKGDMKTGSSVDLRMPGGAFISSDNKVSRRLASDARLLRDGASYFIFIKKRNRQDEDVYIPALGIQSIFEIDFDTKTVIPCDTLKSAPVVQKYLNAPLEAFWEEIKFAVSSEVRRR